MLERMEQFYAASPDGQYDDAVLRLIEAAREARDLLARSGEDAIDPPTDQEYITCMAKLANCDSARYYPRR